METPTIADVNIDIKSNLMSVNSGLLTYPEMTLKALKDAEEKGDMSAYEKCYLATYENEDYKSAFNEFMNEQPAYTKLIDKIDGEVIDAYDDVINLRRLRAQGRIIYSMLNEDLFEDDFAAE